MKKLISAFTVLTLMCLPVQANAVENGISAAGDPRIVSIYKGARENGVISIHFPMCSAFLITNRIVATAQHCTMDPEKNKPRGNSEIFVGLPGEKSNKTPGHHFQVAAIYRAKNYKKYSVKTDLSFSNDVAVLVLAKPIPNVTRARLLNEEEFNAFAALDPQVWIGGYGLQSYSQRSIMPDRRFVVPRKAPASFAGAKEFQSAIDQWKARLGRTFYQESLVGMEMPLSTGTICDGDSGAGFWSKQGQETIYLGVLNGPLGITNCEGDAPEVAISYPGVHPTYQYQVLFDQAEAFVKANPIKGTLICKKGSITKKIIALEPKCPTGYK